MEKKKKMQKKKTIEKKMEKKRMNEKTMQKKKKKKNQKNNRRKKEAEQREKEELDWDLISFFDENVTIEIPSSKKKLDKGKNVEISEEKKKQGEKKSSGIVSHPTKLVSGQSSRQSEVKKAPASLGQPVVEVVVEPPTRSEMKRTLVEKLGIVNSLQKDFAKYSLAYAELEQAPLEKAETEKRVDIAKQKLDSFVRGVLTDSIDGDLQALLVEVGQMKKIIEQHLFDAKKRFDKAEKKKKQDKKGNKK